MKKKKKVAPDLYVYECPKCDWNSWPALDPGTAVEELAEHYREDHKAELHIVGLNA